MNLGAARIFVRDMTEAKPFYTQRLGLTVGLQLVQQPAQQILHVM